MRDTLAIRQSVDMTRLKRIRATHDEILLALYGWRSFQYVCVPGGHTGIPEDAVVVDVQPETLWRGFTLTLSHPSFPQLKPLEDIPFVDRDDRTIFKMLKVVKEPVTDPAPGIDEGLRVDESKEVIQKPADDYEPDFFKARYPGGMWTRVTCNQFMSLVGRAREIISRADDRTGCKRHDGFMHIYLTHEEAMEYGSMSVKQMTELPPSGRPWSEAYKGMKSSVISHDSAEVDNQHRPEIQPEFSTGMTEREFATKDVPLDVKYTEEMARRAAEEAEQEILLYLESVYSNLTIPKRVFNGVGGGEQEAPPMEKDKVPPKGEMKTVGIPTPPPFDLWGAVRAKGDKISSTPTDAKKLCEVIEDITLGITNPVRTVSVKPSGEPMKKVGDAAEGIEPVLSPYQRLVKGFLGVGVTPLGTKVVCKHCGMDKAPLLPLMGCMSNPDRKSRQHEWVSMDKEPVGTKVAEVTPKEGWGDAPIIWDKETKPELLTPKDKVPEAPNTLLIVDEVNGTVDSLPEINQWSEKKVEIVAPKVGEPGFFYRTKTPKLLETECNIVMKYEAPKLTSCKQCGWTEVKDQCPVCGTKAAQTESLLPPELR